MVMGFGICNKVFGWTWKSEMRKVGGRAARVGHEWRVFACAPPLPPLTESARCTPLPKNPSYQTLFLVEGLFTFTRRPLSPSLQRPQLYPAANDYATVMGDVASYTVRALAPAARRGGPPTLPAWRAPRWLDPPPHAWLVGGAGRACGGSSYVVCCARLCARVLGSACLPLGCGVRTPPRAAAHACKPRSALRQPQTGHRHHLPDARVQMDVPGDSA
jgi:hypothetical protein